MATAKELLGGLIQGGKETLGLGSYNLFPGDVNQALTGTPASEVYQASYGGPQNNPNLYTSIGGDIKHQGQTSPSQILGTSTQATPASDDTGGGGGFDWGEYQRRGWNDRDAAYGDYLATGGPGGGGGGGGGQDDYGQLISDAYAPALQALTDWKKTLETGAEEDITNIGSDLATGIERVGTERGQLQASLDEQERRMGETTRSAYADATRTFNNLIQQGLSRFGAGSSAGPAVQELVNQEFLRSRGKMGQQEVQGQQQMAAEQERLNVYLSQKTQDLEKWERDAVKSINDQLAASLQNIEMQRGEIHQNKTNAKLAALQDARARAEAIKDRSTEFRMGIAQTVVEQMQNTTGKVFTMQEIQAVYDDVMNATGGQLQQRTAQAAPLQRLPWVGEDKDELEQSGLIAPEA